MFTTGLLKIGRYPPTLKGNIMNIEVGKTYVDLNNKLVKIIAHLQENHSGYGYVGAQVDIDGNTSSFNRTKTTLGFYDIDGDPATNNPKGMESWLLREYEEETPTQKEIREIEEQQRKLADRLSNLKSNY